MALDPATLVAVFVLLAAVLGALLLFAWALNRKVRGLAWWGGGFCLMAFGIGLANLGKGLPAFPVLLSANALVVLGYGGLYGGCRIFNGRGGIALASLIGPAALLGVFPLISEWQGARVTLISLIACGYSALSAWELWRHAPQRLASQNVAVVLLLALAAFNLLRGMLGLAPSSLPFVEAIRGRWSAEIALFLVVYGPMLAFILLSMAKERVEFDYKQAALIDPLTRVPNRRAFLQSAARLLKSLGDRPASCLLFDLDNFKRVNDTYGHDVGDRILTVFGQTLAIHLPKHSFGRLGGEEFAAILPLSCKDAAVQADAIRRAFRSAGEAVLGPGSEVTVSVGCATGRRATPEELLSRADMALYEAKDCGRDTVVMA